MSWWPSFITMDSFRQMELDLMIAIRKEGGRIMSALTDLQNKVAALTDAIVEEKSEVQEMLTELKDQVRALQDQISSGGTITDADLVAVSTSIDSAIAKVRGISEAV
jgi:peptidoglycan hydrolase CwlO-like protein